MERVPVRSMKVLWHWSAMGPYHFARMSALAAEPGLKLTVVETTSSDDHGWNRPETVYPFELITLCHTPYSRTTNRTTAEKYYQALEQVRPDVIVESGYAEPHARASLFRYGRCYAGTPVLLWSETTAFDHRRFWPVEKYKSLVLSHFDGALVAGTPHLRYVRDLGMPEGAIATIGGTVDNDFFSTHAEQLRGGPPENRPVAAPYFLYVGRFIPVKNLPFLLQAFHLYRVLTPGLAHDLVLVGSGAEESRLRAIVKDMRIDGVHFAGNKQVGELPSYYAFASAFVLPSLSEPWGLVINEAMASGLPILASSACGAAEDLVIPGETGFLFDSGDVARLAGLFARLAADPQLARAMGVAARSQVSVVALEAYASRAGRHLRRVVADSALRGRRAGPLMNALFRCELDVS